MSESFYFRPDMQNKKSVWEFFLSVFKELIASGGCQIDVKPYKKHKTDQQRKYAHACISRIAKDVGDDPGHLKVRIKHGLGLIEKVWSGGEVITVEISTEKLKRDDYGIFINEIIRIAEATGTTLPQPKHLGMEIESRAA